MAGPIRRRAPLLVGLLVLQLRVPGSDPPREAPLPGWIRAVLALQAAALIGVGAALFIAPVDVADAIWPWTLTSLTGRVIAAWLIALGVGVVTVLVENDGRAPAPRPSPTPSSGRWRSSRSCATPTPSSGTRRGCGSTSSSSSAR